MGNQLGCIDTVYRNLCTYDGTSHANMGSIHEIYEAEEDGDLEGWWLLGGGQLLIPVVLLLGSQTKG